MDRDYWDAVALDYAGTVLSVWDHDAQGLVRARIAAEGTSRPGGRAADLGCGVGMFTRVLADVFDEVEACDFSSRALDEARTRAGETTRIRFRQLDLTCDPMPFAPVDFVLCVNVLLMPGLDQRLRAWRTVANQVAHGGMLLLVVPSLESAHFETLCAVDAGLDTGATCAEAMAAAVPGDRDAQALHLGIRELDGVPTKHYLRVELEHLLGAHHFDVLEIRELTYPAVAEPVPWDWLVAARRQ